MMVAVPKPTFIIIQDSKVREYVVVEAGSEKEFIARKISVQQCKGSIA